MCMYIMTSKLRLKYLVQNCTLLLVLKSSFIIFILLILIPTAFWLNNNQWYISFTAMNIVHPDSKESCTVKPTQLAINILRPDSKELCPVKPTRLVGALDVRTEANFHGNRTPAFPWVENGGRGKPSHCISRHRVGIIIPFRNRESHLQTFLLNIHPFLHIQELDYRIFVIDQNVGSQFNRAMLMNIGFVEALKIYDYQCFIFHDVDLIPENDNNIYNCPNQPRHMSVAIDKLHYRLPYSTIFGGVTGLTKEQFTKVNGFSNKFFGWGGEDDDMRNRVRKAGYKVIRYPIAIARYKMIRHRKEKPSRNRLRMLKNGSKRFKTDGINSLKYRVNKIECNPLFTRILVDINEKEVMTAN